MQQVINTQYAWESAFHLLSDGETELIIWYWWELSAFTESQSTAALDIYKATKQICRTVSRRIQQIEM